MVFSQIGTKIKIIGRIGKKVETIGNKKKQNKVYYIDKKI